MRIGTMISAQPELNAPRDADDVLVAGIRIARSSSTSPSPTFRPVRSRRHTTDRRRCRNLSFQPAPFRMNAIAWVI